MAKLSAAEWDELCLWRDESAADPEPDHDMVNDKKTDGELKVKGVGVYRAHEAINSLTRIPKNDALRKQGFRLVTDFIRRNP